jgi:mannose-6-phosphate isomerase-like protein (cupin superfamily)
MGTDPGDTLRQGDTDTMVIVHSAPDLLEVEVTYGPMDAPPPTHYHPRQQEHFHVLSGTLAVLLDGERLMLGAGDDLTVTSGQRHAMWNPGIVPVTFRWRTTPGMRTEAMFRTMWGLVEDGKMGRHGNPRPAFPLMMALVWAYRREWRPASPPAWLLLPIPVIGRLFGHRR